MFTDILVPVDLSGESRSSLGTARELAAPEARITLLHVVETLEDVSFEEMEDFYRDLETRAVETLEGWVGELEREGVRTERVVVFGHRLEEIVRFASEQGSDVVLVRSHRVEPPGRPEGGGEGPGAETGAQAEGASGGAAEGEEAPPAGRGWDTLSYRVAVLAPCPVLLLK